MRYVKGFLVILFYAFLTACIFSGCSGDSDDIIYISNSKISLGFDKSSGFLVDFKDITNSYQYLENNATTNPPWIIEIFNNQKNESISVKTANAFSYSRPDPETLRLTWSDFPEVDNKELQVTVSITLDDEDPLSSWEISLEGLHGE